LANEPGSLPTVAAALSSRFRPWVEWVVGRVETGILFEDFAPATEPTPAARRVLRALLLDAERDGLVEFAVPAGHPLSVQPIAGQLFAAYQVDGGHVQLAGCQLDEHLVCRATWTSGTITYHTAGGETVPDAMRASVGLDHLETQSGLGDASPTETALAMVALCERSEPPRQITLIQCRHASGKVRFTIGNVSWDLPFAGWTGNFSPPPFVCPHTGVATFHLASTDDGRIAAAEEIVACHRTGRRLLRQELARCAVSGAYVLPQYTITCPVTGEIVEQTALVECATCRQLVSPHALKQGECAACREIAEVSSADVRLAHILEEHPGLAKWRHWKLAETADVFIVQAQGVWQRLLAVLDRRTFHCRHMATGNRVSSGWKAVENDAIRDVLDAK
jgi:hypothetical protein